MRIIESYDNFEPKSKSRIDWLATSKSKGSILHITLEDVGNGWQVERFLNLSDLSEEDLEREKENSERKILDGKRNSDTHKSYRAIYNVTQEGLYENPFWQRIIPKESMIGLTSPKSSVDIQDFDKEILKIVKKVRYN